MENIENNIEILENIEAFEYVYDTLELLISRYGAIGIASAMFAESAGVPFASAIVILTAGSMILRGSVSFWAILFASTIGITLGSIFSYILGMLGSVVGNAFKAGYFLYFRNGPKIAEEKPPHRSKILRLWDRYGNFSIFMAQLWGFTRTFVSFPAGAMHMNFYLFVAYTFLGGAIFSLAAIALSIFLTSTMSLTIKILRAMADFSPWLLSIPVLLVIIIVYLYRVRGLRITIDPLRKTWLRSIDFLSKKFKRH